jgi:hypothetical protein
MLVEEGELMESMQGQEDYDIEGGHFQATLFPTLIPHRDNPICLFSPHLMPQSTES